MHASIRLTRADKEKLQWVRKEILKDLTVHHTIPYLAARSRLNEFKLKLGFKLLYGQTVFGLLEEERLSLGVKLLLHSDEMIHVIALRCGYHHSTNFIAAFRRKFKITPFEYRKINKANTCSRNQAQTCLMHPVPDLYPISLSRS
jgi:AraC-like DNA-binding protein